MNISFQHVIPEPLAETNHSDKSIWGSNFSLIKGQRVILNASSGKGKTTFTHTLSGIRSDYSGEIFFGDHSIKRFTANDWANFRSNKLSFVFQDLQLFPKLTVQENLLLKNDLTYTFSEDQLKAMVDELGLADKWNVQCELLSMGQQQRIAIIRSLAQPFDWLIMDEPFSHLDKENTQKCLQIIEHRCKEINAGYILTTLGEFYDIQPDIELNL